jgi:hypothetical protein
LQRAFTLIDYRKTRVECRDEPEPVPEVASGVTATDPICAIGARCANVLNGQTVATPLRRMMNSRRLTGLLTGEKSAICAIGARCANDLSNQEYDPSFHAQCPLRSHFQRANRTVNFLDPLDDSCDFMVGVYEGFGRHA